jgi:hypothetical protein
MYIADQVVAGHVFESSRQLHHDVGVSGANQLQGRKGEWGEWLRGNMCRKKGRGRVTGSAFEQTTSPRRRCRRRKQAEAARGGEGGIKAWGKG